MPLALTATPDPATGSVRLDASGLSLYRAVYLEKLTAAQLGTWTQVATDTTVTTSGDTGLATWVRSAASVAGRVEQVQAITASNPVRLVAHLTADTWPTKTRARAVSGEPRLGPILDVPLGAPPVGPVETRRNRFINPALTANATYWQQTTQGAGTAALTRETVGGPVLAGRSLAYARQTWSAVTTGAIASTGLIFGSPTSDTCALVPGVPNTVSVWVRSSVPARTIQLVFTSHKGDAGGTNQVVEINATQPSAIADASGGWVRLSGTFVPAADQVRGYGRVYATAGRTWQVGDTMDCTAVLVEQGDPTPGDYFDGDAVDSWDGIDGLDYQWTGTAGLSESIELVPRHLPDAMTLVHTWQLPPASMNAGVELHPLSPFQEAAALRIGFVGLYDVLRMQDPTIVRSDGQVLPISPEAAHRAMRLGYFTVTDPSPPLAPVTYTLTDTLDPAGATPPATVTSAPVTLTLPVGSAGLVTAPDALTPTVSAPALVLDYTAGGAAAAELSNVVGRDDPLWLVSSGALRSGQLELFYATYPEALAMLRLALSGERLQLRQDDLDGLDMTFVPTRATQGRAPNADGLDLPPWVVSIDYQEVTP